jgi:hypothetical protein
MTVVAVATDPSPLTNMLASKPNDKRRSGADIDVICET